MALSTSLPYRLHFPIGVTALPTSWPYRLHFPIDVTSLSTSLPYRRHCPIDVMARPVRATCTTTVLEQVPRTIREMTRLLLPVSMPALRGEPAPSVRPRAGGQIRTGHHRFRAGQPLTTRLPSSDIREPMADEPPAPRQRPDMTVPSGRTSLHVMARLELATHRSTVPVAMARPSRAMTGVGIANGSIVLVPMAWSYPATTIMGLRTGSLIAGRTPPGPAAAPSS